MHKTSKRKIAFVAQPFYYSAFPDPGDSIGIVTAQIIRRLSSGHEVSVYTPAPRKTFKGSSVTHDGINYYYIPTTLELIVDKLLSKVGRNLPALFSSKRPL
jgi:hypothetical protein